MASCSPWASDAVATAIDRLAGEQNTVGDKVARALGEALENIETTIKNYS